MKYINGFPSPLIFYTIKIINPFLSSRISVNHENVEGSQLMVKFLKWGLFLYCKISFIETLSCLYLASSWFIKMFAKTKEKQSHFKFKGAHYNIYLSHFFSFFSLFLSLSLFISLSFSLSLSLSLFLSLIYGSFNLKSIFISIYLINIQKTFIFLQKKYKLSNESD